jgi:hypothetical protein
MTANVADDARPSSPGENSNVPTVAAEEDGLPTPEASGSRGSALSRPSDEADALEDTDEEEPANSELAGTTFTEARQVIIEGRTALVFPFTVNNFPILCAGIGIDAPPGSICSAGRRISIALSMLQHIFLRGRRHTET